MISFSNLIFIYLALTVGLAVRIRLIKLVSGEIANINKIFTQKTATKILYIIL